MSEDYIYPQTGSLSHMNKQKRLMLGIAVLIVIASIIFSTVILLNAFSITGAATGASGDFSFCKVTNVHLNSISPQTGYAGTRFIYPVNVTSDCGEKITFSGVTVPDLPSFFINSTTGIIDFTTQGGEEGVYDVNIFVVKTGFPLNTTVFQLTISGSIKPTNFSCIKNTSNSSRINLNWNDADGAAYYKIYYSSNISQVSNRTSNSSIGTNVTTVSFLNSSDWVDTDHLGVDRRYYTVVAVVNGSEGYNDEPVCGKITYQYTTPTSTVYGPLASNRVDLYLNATYTAETWLQEIPAGNNPTISRLDKSNASGEYYTTHVRGLNDGNNFNIDSTIGYLLTSDNYFNHTIVGRAYRPPYNVSYDAPSSSVYGTPSSNARGPHDSIKYYYAENFLQEITAGLNPTISRLDKSNASGEYLTTHVRGLSDGNNFYMQPGIGYLITVDGPYNHTTCITCFK